jgi:hypothetical protein
MTATKAIILLHLFVAGSFAWSLCRAAAKGDRQ